MGAISREHIYNTIRNHKSGLPFYVIKEGSNTIAFNDARCDVDETIEAIEATLNAVESGNVTISLYDKSRMDKTLGGKVTPVFSFTVNVGQKSSASPIGMIDNSNTVKSLQEEIFNLKVQLKEKEFEQKLADLERKIENKNENNDGLGAIIPEIKEYIPAILGAIFGGKTTGIAGTGVKVVSSNPNGYDLPQEKKVDPVYQDLTDVENEMIDKAVDRLLIIDGSFHETITVLADFAEKNPEKYHSFLTVLKSM